MYILDLMDVPIWLIGLVGLVASLYVYSKWMQSYWRRIGVPGPPPTVFLGNIGLFKEKGFWGADMDCVRKYGKLFGTYMGNFPIISVADPNMVKELMVRRFSSFPNRGRLIVPAKEMEGMLTNAVDEHWKFLRNTLTPTFSSGKMRLMSPAVNRCCESLIENIKDQSKDGELPIDMKEICGSFTMDVIASTGFGIDVNSQKDPNNEFVKNAKKVFNVSLFSPLIFLLIQFPFIVKFLNKLAQLNIMKRTFLKIYDFFKSVTLSVMKDRNDDPLGRQDLLQLMLNSHRESSNENDEANITDKKHQDERHKRGLTIDEVTANSFLFFIAGYDTTANTMSFMVYNLALHPEYQEKCIDEIDRVLGKEKPNYDNVLKLDYLDKCMNETLRMYGPVPVTNRQVDNDCEIEGYKIKKGTLLSFSMYAIHHDPEYWPEPEKFIPERFSPEQREKRHPYAFLPFGHGPRSCIGTRLAYLEVKAAIATILQSYRIVRCNETEVPITFDVMSTFLRAKNGIKVKVERKK